MAIAAPKRCISDSDTCNPSLFCSFEAELAAKVAAYKLYLRNSPKTRSAKGQKREGVSYSGKLYNEAVAEAKTSKPGASQAEQLQAASEIFDRKVAEKLTKDVPKFKNCGVLDVQPDDTVFPTWNGMHTAEDCNVYGDTDSGSVFLDELKEGTSACVEFYDRDREHEEIHVKRCRGRASMPPIADPHAIDQHVEEEVAAYRASVLRALNDVRQLGLKCTIDPTLGSRQARARVLKNNILRFKAKGG